MVISSLLGWFFLYTRALKSYKKVNQSNEHLSDRLLEQLCPIAAADADYSALILDVEPFRQSSHEVPHQVFDIYIYNDNSISLTEN
jgi:hypothetical protein